MPTNFQSFSSEREDNGEPTRALDIAGQAVRDFNHRTGGSMRITRSGWRYAPDAYSALRELTYVVGGLPQAFQQIMQALRGELELNLIRMDYGSQYRDDPAAAVEAASVALEQATQAAHQMYQAITAAQNAISAAAYGGVDSSEPDEGD